MFRFDLLFNPENKPTVILSNVQGGREKEVREFERKIKKPLLNHFVDSFTEAFPRAFAYNPKLFSFRKVNLMTLVSCMHHAGKLTDAEMKLFEKAYLRRQISNPLPGTEIVDIVARVRTEATRIKNQTPGAHFSAFKKAAKAHGQPFTNKTKKAMYMWVK